MLRTCDYLFSLNLLHAAAQCWNCAHTFNAFNTYSAFLNGRHLYPILDYSVVDSSTANSSSRVYEHNMHTHTAAGFIALCNKHLFIPGPIYLPMVRSLAVGSFASFVCIYVSIIGLNSREWCAAVTYCRAAQRCAHVGMVFATGRRLWLAGRPNVFATANENPWKVEKATSTDRS